MLEDVAREGLAVACVGAPELGLGGYIQEAAGGRGPNAVDWDVEEGSALLVVCLGREWRRERERERISGTFCVFFNGP